MATRFPTVTQQEIEQIKEDSIPEKTREATKYGVKIFQDKHLNLWWVIVNKKGQISVWVWITKRKMKRKGSISGLKSELYNPQFLPPAK